MNSAKFAIITFLLLTGYVLGQTEDSAGTVSSNEIPGWLKEKIKEMTLDENHYAGTKVFRYETGGDFIYWINNPWSSCIYCELYYSTGVRLTEKEIKEFMKEKDEPLLIWQNYPAVPFDSLKKNIKQPGE